MFQPTETGDWDNLLSQRIFYSPPVGCRHVRPARQLGVNLPKAAGRNHKKYPRFQVEIGDISFHLFPQVAGPCVSSVRCDTMRYLADGNSTLQNNLSAYSHSMALVLSSRHSSCIQFSASTRNACRRMTRFRVSSASGTKVGTTSKTFFKLRALSFCFVPKELPAVIRVPDWAESPVSETQPQHHAQATRNNCK